MVLQPIAHTARRWRQGWLALWRGAPRLRHLVILMVCAEVLAVVVLPAVLPARIYLAAYLSDPRTGEALHSFFNSQGILEPDPDTGWRSRAEVRHGNWVTDEHGARSHEPLSVARQGTRTRVLFLGSSKINGGTELRSDQTISAWLASERVETLNFGTMLFGADQSTLAYRRRLARFQPDVVVLGLDPRADEPLLNVYLPYRNREQVMMPFVKPRFEEQAGGLTEVPPPLALLRDSALRPEALLAFLARHDGYEREFDDYRRYGFTPLAHGADRLWRKLANASALYLHGAPSEGERLLTQLLRQFSDELSRDDRRLVLLLLPDRDDVEASRPWQAAGLRHQRLRQLLANQGLAFVDPLVALRAQNAAEMFHEDRIHYSAAGNRVIALALRSTLDSNRAPAALVGGSNRAYPAQR
jgi:hypothetical protein